MELWYKDGKIKLPGSNKEIELPKGEWVAIGETYDGKNLKLFVEGEVVDQVVPTEPPTLEG